jgi:TolB protein
MDAVCVVTPDGKGHTELNGSARATNPAWSPGGDEIAYASLGSRSSGSGHWLGGDDLYLMNADGTEVSQLTSGESFDSSPAFSSDGSSIVFASDRDLVRTPETAAASGSLYRMTLAGGEVTRLTEGPLDSDPSWSWASDQIAFVRGTEIWVINPDGTEGERLFAVPGRFASAPSWSPDGTQVAFELDGEITIGSIESGILTPLSRRSEVTSEEQDPTWSPDGQQIAFSAIASEVGCRAIFVAALRGGIPSRVTHCDEPSQRLASSPAWRPSTRS